MRTIGALVLLCIGATAAAQPRTAETIEVSIVNVEAVVVDKEGNRVKGLTAADFEIRDAGKVQAITNFAEYGAEVKAGVEAAPRRPRTFILFIDSSRLLPPDAKRMFDSLRALMSEAVQPGDRATIVSWEDLRVNVRQPFTDDVAQLHDVLDGLEKEQVYGPRNLAGQVLREQRESDQDAVIMEQIGPGAPPAHVLDAATRDLVLIGQKTAVLEALMESIAGVEGRKILIMAMRRYGLFAGAEYFTTGEVGSEYRKQFSTDPYRQRLIRTANANGVTLYPLYPIGLPASNVYTNNVMRNEVVALGELADATGGLTAWGAGNIAEMLPRVADDLETHYSLGYRAPATGTDLTRRIEVRVKNPQYRVRARTQFVEKSDATRMKDRMTANLYQDLEDSKIPFDVEVGELRAAARNRWELPLKLRIPISALTTLPQGEQEAGAFTVYVVTGAKLGVMSDVQQKSQPFTIPKADLARAKASHFTFDFVVQVDENANSVSVGVLDETARELGVKRIEMPNRMTPAASQP